MNVTFDRLSDVAGIVTVTLEEKDYADKVKKEIKEIGKSRPEPGFRPGHTPAAILNKKYGKAAKYEVINREVSESLYNYIKENKLKVLGNPMPVADEGFDIDNTDFTFKFNVGLAPEIDTHVNKDLKVPYYNIEVADDMVKRQDEGLRRRFGAQVPGDTVEPDALVKGVITELDENGQPKEGGVVVESGIVAPKYFKSEEQTKLFEGKHVGDVLVFNPWDTCEGNVTEMSSMLHIDKDAVENYKGNFNFEIKEIIVLRPAELGKEYYDQLFGADQVHDEKEYDEALRKMIAAQLASDSNYRFSIDAKDTILKAVGEIDLPDDILKDFLKEQNEALNDENIEEEYAKAREGLVWQLVRDAIAEQLEIKIEQADLMNVAKLMAQQQFAQYGMTNVPEEALEKYAQDILKDKRAYENIVNQAVDMKLFNGIRASVTVEEKNVNVEQFNQLFRDEAAE